MPGHKLIYNHCLVCSSPRAYLRLDLLDGLLGVGLDILDDAVQALLLFRLVLENARDLDDTNHSEEEVDSSETTAFC